MKRFLRRALIWFAKAAAIVIVLLVIFYAEEDWRGARDWAACQKDLQAKGESLDLRQLAPPGKPEDDLSKVPIFAEQYQEYDQWLKTKKSTGAARIYQIKTDLKSNHYVEPPKPYNYLEGAPLDLVAWQKYYRSIPEANLPKQVGTSAQDILQALSQFDPEMNEINIAVKNPNAYWPINYAVPFETSLGSISKMIPLAKVIQLKATAHLDNREADLAVKDYLFSFQLDQPLQKGCSSMNYAVITGVRAIDDSILWEGLRRHVWVDAQLREMESALASTDMLELAVKSYRFERALSVQTMDVIQKRNPDVLRQAGAEGMGYLFATWYIRPSGWWNQDRCHFSGEIQKMIDTIDLSQGTFNSTYFVHRGRQPIWGDSEGWDGVYIPFSAVALPAISNNGVNIARAETYRRLARLACRLEEYRIAHGQYPEKLEDMLDLPSHLNQEVLSNAPLHYQRKGEGYLLYSVGWDQQDDGGLLKRKVTKDGNTWQEDADWVWPSP